VSSAAARNQERELTAEWKCATCSSAQRLIGEPFGLSIVTSLVVMIVSAYAVLRRA
jgi:hypothetical protein